MKSTYVQLTPPCPRCGADCRITDSSITSITCSSCNLSAVHLHRSSPSGLIIADDLAGLSIKRGGAVVKYHGGTLKVTGSVGQISLDEHKNVHVKGGGGGGTVSVERFNDVLVEHAAGDVYVKRCHDVRLDTTGNVYVKRCHDVRLDAAGNVYVKRCSNVRLDAAGDVYVIRCNDVHLDAAGNVNVKRCNDVHLDAPGNVYVKRCNNVRVAGRAGEVEVKRCKDVDAESGGSLFVKRSKDVGVDGGRVVSIKRCKNVEVADQGNGDGEIKRCNGVSLNASGGQSTAKNKNDML